MKPRTAVLALCLAVIFAMTAVGTVSAHEYDRNDTDNPWRLVGYVLHPIGVVLEYTITRPVHALAHRHGWSYLMGHEPEPARARVADDSPAKPVLKPVELEASAVEATDIEAPIAVGQSAEDDQATPQETAPAREIASADIPTS